MLNRSVQRKETERGNALFLILIAVVLFAALSFAITQSNRSTGSSAGEETNTVSGSNVTQYASAVRTGITRMLVRGNVLEDLFFDQPGDSGYTTNPTRQVFHPQGGAVVFQSPDSNLVETGGQWYFFFANVKDMATSSLDAVAVLTKVKRGVCQQINRNIFGSTTVSPLGTAITDATIVAATYNSASPVANTFDFGTTPNKPYGCFTSDSGTQFNYLHVLAEQ
ncbi:MAG TPA: hypothetical protein VGF14_06475 [Alphaproteobacteria bacterium]